jgi:hypothetical protein
VKEQGNQKENFKKGKWMRCSWLIRWRRRLAEAHGGVLCCLVQVLLKGLSPLVRRVDFALDWVSLEATGEKNICDNALLPEKIYFSFLFFLLFLPWFAATSAGWQHGLQAGRPGRDHICGSQWPPEVGCQARRRHQRTRQRVCDTAATSNKQQATSNKQKNEE